MEDGKAGSLWGQRQEPGTEGKAVQSLGQNQLSGHR